MAGRGLGPTRTPTGGPHCMIPVPHCTHNTALQTIIRSRATYTTHTHTLLLHCLDHYRNMLPVITIITQPLFLLLLVINDQHWL